MITKIQKDLISKKYSAKELTRNYLSKISADTTNSYITVTEEAAMSAAEAADKKIASGGELSPLEGIPFTLKDNISTENIKTTCGSKMLENYIPVFDATVWELLRDAGGILLGKTNMDEFAMGSSGNSSYFGPVQNPKFPGKISGGSSSGTAAAVAAGLTPFGIGTDSGGSIRLPAAFCGLPALKPTYGALSRYGLISPTSSNDSAGIIASSAEDIRVVFDMLSRFDKRDATSIKSRPEQAPGELRGAKIGLVSEALELSAPEIRKATEEAVKYLESRGAVVEMVDLPGLSSAFSANYIISCAEASSNLGRYEGVLFGHIPSEYSDADDFVMRSRGEAFGPETKRRIIMGTRVLSGDQIMHKKAMGIREEFIRRFEALFANYSAVLTPAAPVNTPKIGDEIPFEIDIFLSPANLCGLPAVTVPVSVTGEAAFGVQLIGPQFSEHRLLRFLGE